MTIDDIRCLVYCYIAGKDDCYKCEFKRTPRCDWRWQDNNMISDEWYNDVYNILTMVKNTDEKSASKCWETINLIKEKYNGMGNR